MKSARTGVIAVVGLVSCASVVGPPISDNVNQQRKLVEALVWSNGFTCEGLPRGKSIVPIEMFDTFFSKQEIMKLRRCELEPHAYSFEEGGDGAVVFIFKSARRPYNSAHMAGLEHGELWVNESYNDIEKSGFRRLPSNYRWSGP